MLDPVLHIVNQMLEMTLLSSGHFRAQAAASTGYGQQREVKALVDLKESFPVNLARFCGGFQL